jgi:hypothetical protein
LINYIINYELWRFILGGWMDQVNGRGQRVLAEFEDANLEVESSCGTLVPQDLARSCTIAGFLFYELHARCFASSA